MSTNRKKNERAKRSQRGAQRGANQYPQQRVRGGNSKANKGNGRNSNGQYPQGLTKAQKKAQEQAEKRAALKKSINKLEQIKKDRRSILEGLRLFALSFHYNKRYIEILYYALFFIVAPSIFYGISSIAFVFSGNIFAIDKLAAIACIGTSFAAELLALVAGIGLQDLLVKSSKSNKQVNTILGGIFFVWIKLFPNIFELPLLKYIASLGNVFSKILELLI